MIVQACGDGAPEPELQPEIVLPAEGATYRAGDTLTFEGRATDRQDGVLAAEQLTWWTEFHHDDHVHPFHPTTIGATGEVTVPTAGETSANVFLRFHLLATDSDGNTAEVTRDVAPQTVQMTFVTEPAELTIELDGQPHSTPYAVQSVVGMERTIGASEQDSGLRHFTLAGISDGGASPHTVATPDTDTIYTFAFLDAGPANMRPTCVLAAPAPATVGMATTLSVTATDADGSIVSVTFYDGETVIGAPVTNPPYEITWTPTTSGPHALSAHARDDDDAVTVSATVGITVASNGSDAQPPTCTLTAPAALSTNLSGTVNLTATATDDDAVAGVQFQLDGSDLGAEDLSAPYAASLAATSAYASGQHVFRARSRDPAGNVSAWSSVVVEFGGNVDVPASFSLSKLLTSLTGATALAIAPDGRLFVCEQSGTLRIVKNGALLTTPFTTITVDDDGERGLIGVALDPGFAANHYVYVYYTVPGSPPHNRIRRFTADGDVAAAGSEQPIFDLPGLSSATNHNGGAMHFGGDGRLYVAVGDNANSAHAQSDASLFGKVLRLASNGTVPTDNPFYGSFTGDLRAIWAKGFRNPFTFAFHPTSGRMHVNDVGESTYEEVNLGAAGANYGWPTTEGRFDPVAHPAFTNPLFAYGHGNVSTATSGTFLSGSAIVGATFYAPSNLAFPANYHDDYFFGEYVGAFVARYDVGSASVSSFAQLPNFIVDMATAPDGSIYVIGRSELTRISSP